ncbi:hydroxymethylglutaryl-CoA reductase, degradative [Mesohalobacter halotolerans]|uniref:3-hydroxy-3-methylglutaryl coenzyme A reductase n=1 Tax=Mesohalobacter halotolerans TaxID=1883405 RepID=A0A4U5TSM1_9FLAO|nr:hydroxymethylglutaryl-CoA reductase, degradative [Mesohalobacter halotolerans]MBS3737551.1 hydroxymethylglutaryl-CoA reductase, degradative [Psychroflexus sp.]TKS57327.1 hydroxymethylglutaryl-CoA reductase, degradative [Mesohalobacter halotolerans]
MTKISGFSKLTKIEKIEWVCKYYLQNQKNAKSILEQYWNDNNKLQKLHDEFAENTVSNYYLPFGLAPNFTIDDKVYCIPMAIEESSVVAAASKAAKFWGNKGGFKTEVINTTKVGQVHFTCKTDYKTLQDVFENHKSQFFEEAKSITKNMEKRGGGIRDIAIIDKTSDLDNYYQLHCHFETVDAMGANFINSCLEQFGKTLEKIAHDLEVEVLMCILSNYVPECLVRAEVSCAIDELGTNGDEAKNFARRFKQAVDIANVEPFRAVTHNKGIMNGIDAVVLATGNDFRAVEAGVHAYAAKDGHYKSLTHVDIDSNNFKFWIEVPIAVGTVGGLTSLHPLVKIALSILGNPSAKQLMRIVAVAGLAQNFGAVNSLVTDGIQKGHMKMHLLNILNQFDASGKEKAEAIEYFKTHSATHNAVVDFINRIRS